MKNKIFLSLILTVFLISSVIALEIDREELRAFIKTELKDYLRGKDTYLPFSDIKSLWIIVRDGGKNETISINESSYKNETIKVLLSLRENKTLLNYSYLLKEIGEPCKESDQCISNSCLKSCRWFVGCSKRCIANETTLAKIGQYCSKNGQCETGNCENYLCMGSKKLLAKSGQYCNKDRQCENRDCDRKTRKCS